MYNDNIFGIFCQPNMLPKSALFNQFVGLVPLTNIHIHIPAHIEIVGLDVRVVVVTVVHCSQNFLQERLSLTVEMLVIPVRVNIQVLVLADVIDLFLSHFLAVSLIVGLDIVLNEINRTRLDVQNQGAVITHRQSALNLVLCQNSLNIRGDLCFFVLVHPGHAFLRLTSFNTLYYTSESNYCQPKISSFLDKFCCNFNNFLPTEPDRYFTVKVMLFDHFPNSINKNFGIFSSTFGDFFVIPFPIRIFI